MPRIGHLSEEEYEDMLDLFIDRHPQFGEWKHIKGEGGFSYTLEYLNVQIFFDTTNDDPFPSSFQLLCMPGQCSTLIIADVYEARDEFEAIEELAKEFCFSKLILTDNEPVEEAVNHGFKLTDTFTNERTGNEIFQYEYKLYE